MTPRSAADLERRPLVAIWETTRACDLACRHCRANARPGRDPRELSTEEALALVVQLWELDPAIVVLTGGDPLKRPDLHTIIGAATQAGLRIALAPSVTPLLTTKAIHRFADAGVRRIALSLDGPDATTHDGLRGVPGSYAATLAAAATVRAAGVELQINTSLTRQTLWELPATGARIADLAPELWSLFFVVPVGRAERALELDGYACEAAFHFLADWSERTGVAAKTTAAPAYRRVLLERRARAGGTPPAPTPTARPINDGKGFVFVSHTGEVYPSGFLPVPAGNVREMPLARIYRNAPLLRALRRTDLLEGKCGVCRYRSLCGGSRARAFAATGNAFAADPACIHQPEGAS